MKVPKNSRVFIKNIRKQSDINEEEIMRLSDFNKRVIDSAPISIITIDKNGIITSTNKYFKNLSSSKVPLYRSIFENPFFIRERLAPLYKKLLADGIPFKKENCHTKNSLGQEKYISIVAVPLKDKKGNIDGALSMALDVTEAVKAKLELHKLNKNLKERVLQKTQQLQKINEKLKKSLKLRSQFISDASHELRTPLSIAKLNLEFFKKQFPDNNKSSLQILNAIDSEINRVADILSDITFFTAIDEEAVESMNIDKIYLNKFLEDLSGRIKSLADKKNINIIFKKNKSNPAIGGDKIKLEKLFLNIIANSIKYGKTNGWVKIQTEQDLQNKAVKIIISDNGVGILKKDLPRIFDRFYRTGLSRYDGEGGFGLGLSICKWIVEKHNGKIVAESAAGRGSVFTIILPINVGPAA